MFHANRPAVKPPLSCTIVMTPFVMILT